MSDNLLVTKLYIPAVSGTHITRPRLFELLDDGLRNNRRLILLSAPAGYGKTSLLSEWIHSRRITAAWLSIDEGDNDPVRFFSYLVASVKLTMPEIGDQISFQLTAAGVPQPDLVSLANGLTRTGGPLLIVLDDYHVIHAQPVHDSLVFLLGALPPTVQIALATRADPPLPLARLRARGQLIELRMNELRFTTQETDALLSQVMDYSLSADDINSLDQRTEGWAAGLQLAALALTAYASHSEWDGASKYIHTFTSSSRYILDYFIDEVLHQQSEAVLDFMQKTSILERLCGSLCDMVAGIPSQEAQTVDQFPGLQTPLTGSRILEYMDRSNLFIVPLDDRRQWYRYHHLFADLLNQRLIQNQPGIVSVLHERASRWYQQHNFADEAIRHAFSAGNTQHAAELIAAAAESTLMRSEIATFTHWISQLPPADLHSHPDLIAYEALIQLWNAAPLEIIEATVTEIDKSYQLSGMGAPLKAFIAICKGDLALTREYVHQALSTVPRDRVLVHGLTEMMQAICTIMEGNIKTGVEMLEDSALSNRKTGNLLVAVFALYQLAELRYREGKLDQAQALYRQSLDLATDESGSHLPIAGRALAGLGEIAWARNDLDSAQRDILAGNKLAENWSQISAFDGYCALVQVRLSQADFDEAVKCLSVLHNLADQFDVSDIDDLVVDMLEARVNLARGNLAAVYKWAEQRGLAGAHFSDTGGIDNFVNLRLRKYEALILARLRLIEGQDDQVLEILDQIITQVGNLNRPVLVIQTELLRALALQEKGQTDKAMLALENALSLAEPVGFVRIFVDEGEKLYSLLMTIRSQLKEKALQTFVNQLLLSFDTPQNSIQRTKFYISEQMIEPLSMRELDVLRLLPSSLSNKEMADELVITIHTLRSHLKSIYEKLDVHSRYEAVSRARELKLM